MGGGRGKQKSACARGAFGSLKWSFERLLFLACIPTARDEDPKYFSVLETIM